MYSTYQFGHILRDQSGTIVGEVQGLAALPNCPPYYKPGTPGNDKVR